ncbi:uncharacterized protein K489DRAFT_30728 [Dissoconium aciculare CBS 342.82]|uniref:Uncharacterized protein n=1 Tax=Dissoconium aciculare CBS 342.82 TaxID=1314786 RepID=A0A6J3MIZ7_9PEZI|nr:uncharacterized protein K489DRAFT_30728 [Dissoconium aciculare CBS 342.82]KAF1827870.1 hypothetical protein K489DRAFT_30728 [Dissoconium aciculare CBS 342.82]
MCSIVIIFSFIKSGSVIYVSVARPRRRTIPSRPSMSLHTKQCTTLSVMGFHNLLFINHRLIVHFMSRGVDEAVMSSLTSSYHDHICFQCRNNVTSQTMSSVSASQ